MNICLLGRKRTWFKHRKSIARGKKTKNLIKNTFEIVRTQEYYIRTESTLRFAVLKIDNCRGKHWETYETYLLIWYSLQVSRLLSDTERSHIVNNSMPIHVINAHVTRTFSHDGRTKRLGRTGRSDQQRSRNIFASIFQKKEKKRSEENCDPTRRLIKGHSLRRLTSFSELCKWGDFI